MYIVFLSLTFSTNKDEILKLHSKYYIKKRKKLKKNIQNKYKGPNDRE